MIIYVITVTMCFKYPFDVYKCGKCPECLQEKRREWSVRLQLHTFFSGDKPFFCHLTYDNEHVPVNEYGNLTLSKRDVQLFLKRLRSKLNYYEDSENSSNGIKYYIAGEYGPSGTRRPHYHCIIFGMPQDLEEDEAKKIIQQAWQNGDVRKRSCWLRDYAQLHYVTKYMINFFNEDFSKKVPPFRMCSSGIGKPFIDYALKNNLYRYDIQKLFVPTRVYLDNRNHKHAVGWKFEKPIVYDYEEETYKVNSILSNFRDFIEFPNVVHGVQKVYRFPLPKYFKDKLYTENFRMALAEVKLFDFAQNNTEYFSEYFSFDRENEVPMWLQLKRYLWSKAKKTKKDKLIKKTSYDILND